MTELPLPQAFRPADWACVAAAEIAITPVISSVQEILLISLSLAPFQAGWSVVVEEEESDGETKGQGDQATRQVGEITAAPEHGTAIEWTQPFFGKIKRHKLDVVFALVLLMAAVASAVYFSSFRGNGQAVDSLAVLPFVNVGADPNTEYLTDGITDSLINRCYAAA